MLNEKDKQKIIEWYEKFCYSHKIDSDLFDIDSEIDSSITLDENLNIIEDKLNNLSENGTLLNGQVEREKARLQQEAIENVKLGTIKIKEMFNEPKVIAICSDVHEGKSMFLYHLIRTLQKEFSFNLYSYGLRKNVGETKIHSVEELEQITNSVICLDEFFSLLQVEERKKREQVEKTLRLIYHNNNILILCGTPENFKKFISAKVDIVFFKKVTLADLVNGSRMKNICTNYRGIELGSSLLNVPKNKCIVYDGQHYSDMLFPYMEEFDTKKGNLNILQKCSEKCAKSVNNNVQNEFKPVIFTEPTIQEIEQEFETVYETENQTGKVIQNGA